MFIKTTFKDLNTQKKQKLIIKMQSIFVFLDLTKVAVFQ